MNKKLGFIFCFKVLIPFSFIAQFNAINYNKYPYINQDLNHIKIYGNKTWNKFFRKLDRLYENGNENLNIYHFGGSHIQADIWSNNLRENFQHSLPFNNAGRGFFFPFRLIKSNGSPIITSSHSGKWKGYRNSVNYHNGPFGLLGARAELLDSSSTINIWYKNPRNQFNSFQEIDLFFEDSSNNYDITLILDSTIQISSQNLEGHIKYQLSKAVDSLSFSIAKKQNIESKFSLFGFYFDNNKHGISYHSIGVNGASVPSYLRCVNLENQLELMPPDLVIFSIGINDAYENDFSKESYSKNYDTLIQRIYSINPEAAILFTTNNDSYYHRKHPNKRVYEAKEAMVDLAKAKKLAVWDMFEIMGGLNSIQKWYSDDLAKKDLLHLNYKGYNLIGDLLFEAFMEAYKKYTTKNG